MYIFYHNNIFKEFLFDLLMDKNVEIISIGGKSTIKLRELEFEISNPVNISLNSKSGNKLTFLYDQKKVPEKIQQTFKNFSNEFGIKYGIGSRENVYLPHNQDMVFLEFLKDYNIQIKNFI